MKQRGGPLTGSRPSGKRPAPAHHGARGNLVDLHNWSSRKRRGRTATLLVGTDFSTRSDRALRRATALARQWSYELLLVHVVADGPLRSVSATPDSAPELLREIERSIAETDGIPCRSEIRSGSVAGQLASAARESGAELLLVGPHRRAFLRDRFSHTTAERIIRQAPVPLMVANAAPAPYRSILHPTDLGEHSRRALIVARSLPFVEESALIFLYLYDAEARQMLGRTMTMAEEQHGYFEAVALRARTELANYATKVGCPGVRGVVRESSGSIASGIVRFAAEAQADLIVFARSGKGVVAEAVVGSVSEAVLRSSTRDLLIVPDALP